MHYIYYAYVFMRSYTYFLTYLQSWLCEYKTGNISEPLEDRAKVTINGLYIKSFTGFRLLPKAQYV